MGLSRAGLRGALHEHILPHTGIPVRIPAERLFHVDGFHVDGFHVDGFHIDGTPRENFIPLPLSAISSSPTSSEKLAPEVPDPTLRAAYHFIQQNAMSRK
jgi:hypothetical protein